MTTEVDPSRTPCELTSEAPGFAVARSVASMRATAGTIGFPSLDGRVMELVAAGERIAGRFEVERLAAVGGLSVVYRALDHQTQSYVAVKVLLTRDPEIDLRFENEAAILADLAHSAVVRYIAHGTTQRHALYLAMEWLPGRDLAARLADTGLRASEGLALMRQLCAGLSAAHQRGVLHRDIKPSNIFLVDDAIETAKILDFGVARREVGTSHLTKAGALIGTVGYMAPEQARGALQLDARSDVFSLGCLLYEILTGQPAFSGAHDLAVLAKVLRDEPPLVSALRPELGAGFDELMERLLAKDRAHRPASALLALEAIEQTFAEAAGPLDSAPPAARARTSYGEQRILSVIVGQPRGLAAGKPAPEQAPASSLEELTRDFDAEVLPMRGGALLLLLAAGPSATATDQAIRVARCGLSLARKRPELVLGLATGAVDTSSGVPMGVAIDRAAALIDASQTDRVKVDTLTASLLGARFFVRETSHGLVLESEREDSDGVDVLMGRSTPFVGRAKELAILSAGLCECIAEESTRGVLVTGMPGAGKSRLGREFVERVRLEMPVQILFARADLSSAGSPLSLVQSLLRNAASVRVGTTAAEQRRRLEAYLRATLGPRAEEQLSHFLSELLGVGEERPERALQRAARGDPEVMREQKRRAFERWLKLVVESGPVLLFVEDLHWGDLPSITYLQDFMLSLTKHALFVVATARPELHAQFPQLRDEGRFEELCLRGLTKKASVQLARTMLPSATPDATIEHVVALSSGNAFYLEELVRRVAEGGGLELPETVVAMAQSRIERLPPEARRVLRAASIFGERAWASGIDMLLASTPNEGLLGWLIEQEILQHDPNSRFAGDSEYNFRHALLREAAYAMLTEADRKTGHTRAGEWLESRGERDATVLADHFERGGAVARAVPWVSKAAMAALDSGDFESAIAQSRRGTSLGAYGYQRGMLLLVRSYAATWKCDPELPGEALSLLPRASAPWWLALSLHVFGSSLLGRQEAAEPYLELALTTSPNTELTSAYGHAVHVLSAGAALLGRSSIGWALVRHFEHASATQDSEPDPAGLAWFNLAKCILASNSLVDGGQWALGQALSWGDTSIEAMRVLGSASGEAAALFHVGNAYWLAGNFTHALGLLQQAKKLAHQTGNLLVEEHADLLLAVAAMRDGSRSSALDALTALASSTNLQLSHAAATILADCYCRDGQYEQAIERAQQSSKGCSLMYRRSAYGIMARALLARADFTGALAATDRAFEQGGELSFPHLTVDLWGSRARALLGCDARLEATRLVERASSFRDAVAQAIQDPESRRAFRSRGQANRVLDQLAASLTIPLARS